MLKFLQSIGTTIGLNGNVIYDVVGEARDNVTGAVRPLSQNITVSATAFHVTCGLLPQARQNGTSNGTVWSISTPLRTSGQYFDAAPIRLLSKDNEDVCQCVSDLMIQAAVGLDFFPIRITQLTSR
jgi:hypothetical protein